MKKIKIGKKEYDICETAEDLPIKRYTALKHYLMYKQLGVDVPDLNNTLERFVRNFDNERKAQMIITLNDYITGVKMVEDNKDPDQLAFAVITFDKDEDKLNFDETKGFAKLEEMASEGLTQKVVEHEVTAFIQASSAHFVTYLRENLMRQMEEQLG